LDCQKELSRNHRFRISQLWKAAARADKSAQTETAAIKRGTKCSTKAVGGETRVVMAEMREGGEENTRHEPQDCGHGNAPRLG
jgi:hypothetical protein